MNKLASLLINILKYTPTKEEGFILKENQTDTNAPWTPKKEEVFADVSSRVLNNLNEVKKLYDIPKNHDVMIREFMLSYNEVSVPAFIVFIDGMVNNAVVNESILEPLMMKSTYMPNVNITLKEHIKRTLIPQNQVSLSDTFEEIISGVNFGCCAVFADGVDSCFICDVKTWEHRTISQPLSENVIRGPQEGFSETLRMNTALLRKSMTDRNLMLERVTVGSRSRTPVIIAYLSDVVNPALLEHVKNKFGKINADYCFDSGELEQLIEDNKHILAPQMHATERPDRACQALSDGRIVILVNGSPYALILPALFTDFLYSVEDRYIRSPYAILLRTIRIIAVFLSVFLSGIFIAIVTFHKEFVPTQLLLSIQVSSQNVSFPTLFQLLFLELLFEILHEASIRMPKHIGSIIGIVGALVIGTSLITANIVSPIIIICTAMSVLSTFANPSYMQNIHLRILRFLFILTGAVGGLPYLGIATVIVAAFLVRLKSFGVPYFTPVAPFTNKSFPTGFWRSSISRDFLRTDSMNPNKKYKKKVGGN